MKLTVTSANIDNAIRSDANHCMIAEAIKEKIPTARWVLVDLQSIRWTDREAGRRFIFMTPKPAQKALLAFDKGLPVKPFHVTLPAPESRPIPSRKPRKTVKGKTKAKPKKIYKKAKVAPEQVAVRRHGLRLFE
jgi:hypothetical protein